MHDSRKKNIQRNTLQRKIVLDVLLSCDNHPTIEELYAKIQVDYPSISKTTVYRNLRILAQNGIVHQVSVPDGPERYEGNTYPHYHFKCNICQSIFDIDIEILGHMEGEVSDKYGFKVSSHSLTFMGTCKLCQTSNNHNHKEAK